MVCLLIHGGVGVGSDPQLNPQTEQEYHSALAHVLAAGYALLAKGQSSLDAVLAAVCALEDDPLFNAGTGSVLTLRGEIEMDAAVMNGNDLQAGAVTGVNRVQNPILLANAIRNHSAHVMLAGQAAHTFAKQQAIPLIDPETLITPQKRKAWQACKKSDKLGTVGAVALDQNGQLAAATSTGGLMHKLPGRVSDSCIIGAGTYANKECAISTTGDGEYFIRSCLAKTICDKVSMQGLSITDAVQDCLQQITDLGGLGGVIALDKNGDSALICNAPIMYRGKQNAAQQQTWISYA